MSTSPTTPVRDETLNIESVRERIFAKMRSLPAVDNQGHPVTPATPPPTTSLLGGTDPAPTGPPVPPANVVPIVAAPRMAPDPSQGSSYGGAPAPARPRTVAEMIAAKLGTLPDVDANGLPQ